jgi:hypothetical protein
MSLSDQAKKFYEAYYGSLVGCTCIKAEMVKEEEHEFSLGDFWPELTFQKPDGETFVVSVSQDEEGNGPGFLFGLERPEP